MTPNLDELLTPKQAAAYLKVATTTLEGWRSKGGGPAFTKIGRKVGYPAHRLQAWLETRTRTSTSEQLPA